MKSRKNLIRIVGVFALLLLYNNCGQMRPLESLNSSSTLGTPAPSPSVRPSATIAPSPAPSPGQSPTPRPSVTPMPTLAPTATPTPIVTGDAERDWLLRTGQDSSHPQSGVVWFHDFRTDNEVNNFRWSGGVGNHPDASNSNVRRINDGIPGTGGGALEIIRPPGTSDGSVWWRPYSPIVGGTTTGNGRGVGNNDPGANGTISAKPSNPMDRNQIANWWKGFYGNRVFWPDSPSSFDGDEYWIQVRVKMDPNRILGGNSVQGGKLFYFTRTDRSLTSQEIVTVSGWSVGSQNAFNMYRSGSPPLDQDSPGTNVLGNQPRADTPANQLCRFSSSAGLSANCWYWPQQEEWVTLMWHIVPGKNQGSLPLSQTSGEPSGNHDTLIEVFVANAGEKSFRRIWNQPQANMPWDVVGGHNGIIASIYHNGLNMPRQFYHRYTQMIFSKSPIPCPQY